MMINIERKSLLEKVKWPFFVPFLNVYLLSEMKGGSSRKPMVMWNFSGTPGGGTWLSPGQTIS